MSKQAPISSASMSKIKTFNHWNLIRNWSLVIILILVAPFRYFSSRPVYKNGDTIKISTTVFSDTISYGSYQTFSAAGIKIYLPAFPEIFYGDKIVVEGVVEDGKLKKAKLISKSSFSGFGSRLRRDILSFYQKVLPQPVSGLIGGITLGSKGGLTVEFWEKAKTTGVAHVVVASGTNVTFVISFIFGVASFFLPRRRSISIVILSIILYLFLSGFQAPLIRASIMAGVTFLAESSGRLVKSFQNLFLTAGVMLAVEPDWITDIGFILSFVSTASIMLLGKRVKNLLKVMPPFLREGFSTSLAAQAGVAPVLFVTFGQFNLLSPLINAFVLWTVPYIMILASLGGVLGLVFPALGKLILLICYPLGWWFTEIVEVFG